jgi:hypothetical protein
MARKRSTVQKREREFRKRQRQRKKAEKAAEKRERRLHRGQSDSTEVSEQTEIATDAGDEKSDNAA